MTIIEIKAMRIKQEKLRQEKYNAHQSFAEANQRIMEDLDLQEQIAHDELVKRIRKHFKGVMPSVNVSMSGVIIKFEGLKIVKYVFGMYSFSAISRKLADKIISEYVDVYGYPEETSHISSIIGNVTTNISFGGNVRNPIQD